MKGEADFLLVFLLINQITKLKDRFGMEWLAGGSKTPNLQSPN
jgi:hypothetical protein